MAKKSIYSNVARTKKNHAKTVAIVLAVVSALLLIFIIWCAFMFSGDGVYGNTVSDVTNLKIQLNEKDAQINTLKEQIAQLEEQKRQLERDAAQKEPTTTLPPTPSPSVTPKPAQDDNVNRVQTQP